MLKKIRAEDAGVCKIRYFKIRTATFVNYVYGFFALLIHRIDITVASINPALRFDS
jgi:hypothetical protein